MLLFRHASKKSEPHWEPYNRVLNTPVDPPNLVTFVGFNNSPLIQQAQLAQEPLGKRKDHLKSAPVRKAVITCLKVKRFLNMVPL